MSDETSKDFVTDRDFAEKKSFVGYEYKEIIAEGSRASLLLDGYESFGWEIDERLSNNGTERIFSDKISGQKKVTVRIRRNRKIINKMELTRLQRNFEACIHEIDMLEQSKTSVATMYALVLAFIGTAFMAGATFAAVGQPPYIALSIILALPGFAGWIFPPFLHKKILRKQTEKITPLIEEKYDEIYELCEKGNKLLH